MHALVNKLHSRFPEAGTTTSHVVATPVFYGRNGPSVVTHTYAGLPTLGGIQCYTRTQ